MLEFPPLRATAMSRYHNALKIAALSDPRLQQITTRLVEKNDHASWRSFADSQSLGDCQEIVSEIRSFGIPGVEGVFGEIRTDDPYVDEYGEEQEWMTHHWVTVDGRIAEFSKGSLRDHVAWDDPYDPDPEFAEYSS